MNEFLDTYVSADILIDSKSGEVKSQSHPYTVRLSPVNLRVLLVLIDHAEQTVSRQQLFDLVWPNQTVSDDALTRSISDLRSQLKPLTEINPLIDTIPKVGYRWVRPLASTAEVIIQELPAITQTKLLDKMKLIISSLLLLLIFSWGFLGLIRWWEKPVSVPLVILPTQITNSKAALKNTLTAENVTQSLKSATSKHKDLQYLSQFAIQSHQGSPFPFFNRQYGVRWFIESQFSAQAEFTKVTINLVDANTALVIYSDQQTINSAQDLNNMSVKFLDYVAQLQ